VKSESLHQELHALGESKTVYKTEYDQAILEKFPNPYKDIDYEIEVITHEFSNLCPKTGQPDFATIEIQYSPDEWCLESKSYKLYIFSFRSEGAFHEEVTNRIARDLFNFLKPNWIRVVGKFNARGGITFHPTVTLRKEDFE